MISNIVVRKQNGSNFVLMQSITKFFVCIVLHILSESGQLSYEDKIKKYYPKFHDGITILDIIQHKSGLYNKWEDPNYKNSKHLDYALNLDIVYPQNEYQYNNYSYDILCGIIKKISGQNACKILDKLFFKPNKIKANWYSLGGNLFGGFGLAIHMDDIGKLMYLPDFLEQIKYVHKQDYSIINNKYYGHSGSGGQFLYMNKKIIVGLFTNGLVDDSANQFAQKHLKKVLKLCESFC